MEAHAHPHIHGLESLLDPSVKTDWMRVPIISESPPRTKSQSHLKPPGEYIGQTGLTMSPPLPFQVEDEPTFVARPFE
jgi:hypothetical protein